MADERNRKTASFEELPRDRRKRFVQLNHGFLATVAAQLGVARATVMRTWYSDFRKPNPAILEVLDAAYRCILIRDAKRRERLKLGTGTARPTAA